MRLAAIAVAMLGSACSSMQPGLPSEPSPYLLVLAGDKDGKEEDFFAVVDMRNGSKTQGKVVSTKQIGHRNSMPHHMEYWLPESGELLFANAHHPELTMLVDVGDPKAIQIRKTITPPPPYRFTHDYARVPGGNVLMGFLRSDGPSPKTGDTEVPGGHGGIAEYTADGKLLRTASAAVDGLAEPIRPYAIVPLLDIDRIVTTSARMMEKHTAKVVQVWRYSDLKLLKTIEVPAGKGPDGSPEVRAGEMPFGPRIMPDGSVFLNSYNCGFYRLTDIASDEPRLTHVYDFHGRDPASLRTRVGCSVPVLIGDHWIMPVAESQMIVVLDVSNPSSPREVWRLPMPPDFYPHWAAKDPNSNRIVFGAELTKEQGMFILLFDPQTGKLSLDQSIVSPAAGKPGFIDLEQQAWPHGDSGPAWGHAALFLPSD